MRTPEEIVDQIANVLPTTMSRWPDSRPLVTTLLAAWRDEIRAEAPAGKKRTSINAPSLPADDKIRDCMTTIRQYLMLIEEEGQSIDRALLSRAPLAERAHPDALGLVMEERNRATRRAEAAEAERDRLKHEMRFIEESARPMARINAELEAELAEARGTLEGERRGWTRANAALQEMRDHDALIIKALREENEALREIISESAPVAWVGRDDIASAKAWEIKATALLRAEGAAR